MTIEISLLIDSEIIADRNITPNKKSEWLHAWEKESFSNFNQDDYFKSIEKNNIFKEGADENKDFIAGFNEKFDRLSFDRPLKEPEIKDFLLELKSNLFFSTDSRKISLLNNEVNAFQAGANQVSVPVKDALTTRSLAKGVQIKSYEQSNNGSYEIIHLLFVQEDSQIRVWIRDYKKTLNDKELNELVKFLREAIYEKEGKKAFFMLNAKKINFGE